MKCSEAEPAERRALLFDGLSESTAAVLSDVSIDVTETQWQDIELPLGRVNVNDLDWHQHQVTGSKYLACGGPFSLGKLIQIFLMK
jgi:hypothetical protein